MESLWNSNEKVSAILISLLECKQQTLSQRVQHENNKQNSNSNNNKEESVN